MREERHAVAQAHLTAPRGGTRQQLRVERTARRYGALSAQTRLMKLHGWVYDIEHGSVDAYDQTSGTFKPLEAADDARGPTRGSPASSRKRA